MDLETLKREADILGYQLVKKKSYVRFKPCICGHDYMEKWFTPDEIIFRCCNCGLEARGANEQEARKNWNAIVENYISEPKPIMK